MTFNGDVNVNTLSNNMNTHGLTHTGACRKVPCAVAQARGSIKESEQNNNTNAAPSGAMAVQIGKDNLPILPHTLLPRIKSSITSEYCKRPEVWCFYWVLDPDQREYRHNRYEVSDKCANHYRILLRTLYEEILRKGKELFRKIWLDSFTEDGFLADGKAPSEPRHIYAIVRSRAMREKFEQHLLYPFYHTFKNAYTYTIGRQSFNWLHPELKSWARKRQTGVNFDFEYYTYDSELNKEIKNNIIKIALQGSQHLIASLRKAEEDAYGMSLRLRLKPGKDCGGGDNYWLVCITDEFVKLGINDCKDQVYLRVSKTSHPIFTVTPTYNQLSENQRDEVFFFGCKQAQCSIASGLSLNAALDCTRRAFEKMQEEQFVGKVDACYTKKINAPQLAVNHPLFDNAIGVDDNIGVIPVKVGEGAYANSVLTGREGGSDCFQYGFDTTVGNRSTIPYPMHNEAANAVNEWVSQQYPETHTHTNANSYELMGGMDSPPPDNRLFHQYRGNSNMTAHGYRHMQNTMNMNSIDRNEHLNESYVKKPCEKVLLMNVMQLCFSPSSHIIMTSCF